MKRVWILMLIKLKGYDIIFCNLRFTASLEEMDEDMELVKDGAQQVRKELLYRQSFYR